MSAPEDDALWASLGVIADSAEHVEQVVLEQAMRQQQQAPAAGPVDLPAQLFSVRQEALATQQHSVQEHAPRQAGAGAQTDNATDAPLSAAAEAAATHVEGLGGGAGVARAGQAGLPEGGGVGATAAPPLLAVDTPLDSLARRGLPPPTHHGAALGPGARGDAPASGAAAAAPTAGDAVFGAAAPEPSHPRQQRSVSLVEEDWGALLGGGGGPRALGGGGAAAAAAEGPPGRSGVPLPALLARAAQQAQYAALARPTTVLVDPRTAGKLPVPGRQQVGYGFWNRAAGGSAAAAAAAAAAGPAGRRPKRARTLAPARQRRRSRGGGAASVGSGARRKRLRRSAGAGGEAEGEREGAEDEGGRRARGAAGPLGAERRGGAARDDGSGTGSGSSGGCESEWVPSDEAAGGRASRQAAGRRRRWRRVGAGSGDSHSDTDSAGEGSSSGSGSGSEGDLSGSDSDGGSSDAEGGEDAFDDAADSVYDARVQRTGGAGDGGDGEADAVLDGGLRVPALVWGRLFDYQRAGVKWLWELHTQRVGGILGDEMGLGKTVQVIAYLAGLHASRLYRPSLVVCPATVLRQWVRELRTWHPPFRVFLLHDSGRSPPTTQRPSREDLVECACRAPTGVVLTTYEGLRRHRELLLPRRWGAVVLDEGHKIRNPDSDITLTCKQLRSEHRLLVSGSPIQNRLAELWSLFDFVFPGKLGTLPVFTAQFAVPITIGGYANASQLQVAAAYRCAVVLRDLISPYLLRRRKADVATQLPAKTEQVLFCTLTPHQVDLYRAYLTSGEVEAILEGRRQALAGIDILRKLCNHPDLLERATMQGTSGYGDPERSAKLQVVVKLLAHWRAGGHKVLLFTQTQQMLDILERLTMQLGYSYHRMDGGTSVALRARLMDDFNASPDRFLFLLTTKVGGLGVNLTGADRVLIYDPDWNPSTDVQARERAWRIGQQRPVTIYRLITRGTIEEKVYHRQIYKNHLTSKVLRDPRQKRFFSARDLSDLFTLGDEYGGSGARPRRGGGGGGGAGDTETERLFKGVAATLGVGEEEEEEVEEREGEGEEGGARRRARGAKRTRPAARLRGGRRGGEGAGEGDSEGEEEGDAAPTDDAGDARVLRDLFEGAGLAALVDHSAIEGANDPEARLAAAEAAKIAARAADAVRASRSAVAGAPVGEPTWTGRHGTAGAPAPAAPAGPSRRPAPPPPPATARASMAPTPAPGKRFGAVTNPRLRTAGGAAPPSASSSPAPAGVSPSAAARASAGLPQPPGGPPPSPAGRARATAPPQLSSSALLSRARARQQQAHAAAAPGRGDAPSSSAAAATGTGAPAAAGGAGDADGEAAATLAAEVVSFLEARGGAAESADLVAAFEARVGAGSMPVFRALLKQVAVLRQPPPRGGGGGGGGVARWHLRPDFWGGGDGGGGEAGSSGAVEAPR